MTLPAYALVSLAELKAELTMEGPAPKVDPKLETLIVQATAIIESQGLRNRPVVTRGSIQEWHSPFRGMTDLYLSQWPIIAVTSVHESYDRTYDGTTLLAVSTDYLVDAATGKLIRVASSSGALQGWASAFEAVQVLFTAGYSDTASVPPEIKGVCLRLCARAWKQAERQQWGLTGFSDATGNFSRVGQAALTPQDMAQLAPYRRMEWPSGTTLSRVA